MAISDQVVGQILSRAEKSVKLAPRIDVLREVLRGNEPMRAGLPSTFERANGSKAPNGAEFHVKMNASTEKIARDGGYVPLDAWSHGGLAKFRQNPVILEMHNYRKFPLGVSVFEEINREANALQEYWLFHDITPEAKIARQMYEGGWMRASSVGFIVQSGRMLSDKEANDLQKRLGTDDDVFWMADRTELTETSAVPVPSDAHALAVEHALLNARAAGVDIDSFARSIGREHIIVRSESMDPKNTPAPAAEQRADNTLDIPAAIRTAMETVISPLSQAITALTEEVRAIRAAQAQTTEPVVTEQAAAPAAPALEAAPRSALPAFITKREGETDEQALLRAVEEAALKRLGAPVPRTNK